MPEHTSLIFFLKILKPGMDFIFLFKKFPKPRAHYTMFLKLLKPRMHFIMFLKITKTWNTLHISSKIIYLKGPGTYFVAMQPHCYAEFFARRFYFRLCVLFFPGSEVFRLLLIFRLFLKLFGFNNFQEFCFCISIMY